MPSDWHISYRNANAVKPCCYLELFGDCENTYNIWGHEVKNLKEKAVETSKWLWHIHGIWDIGVQETEIHLFMFVFHVQINVSISFHLVYMSLTSWICTEGYSKPFLVTSAATNYIGYNNMAAVCFPIWEWCW